MSTAPASAQTSPPPAGDYVIKNRWKPSQVLNVQSGRPQASPASETSASAQWGLEPTGTENLIRLRNRATGLYLTAERGLPQAVAASPDQVSAQWGLEYLSGIPDPRIRNRASGGYLHINDGPLVIGDASPEWGTAFWKLVPVGEGVYVPPPVQGVVTTDGIPPPPQVACAGKWMWSGGKHVCVPSCPPGWHPAGLACVKNCPPGWHPVGNICVPNCPSGWHLSFGHCCPAGKNWNQILHQCK